MRWLLSLIIPYCLFIATSTESREYNLPEQGRLIGTITQHPIQKGDYFQKLAEQYNVGFLALLLANPSVDPFLPTEGQTVIIPTQMLLPYIDYQGIVINLPELRLYYFLTGESKVMVFPIGIGRVGLATPNTTSYISEKNINPVWRPSQATRLRYLNEYGHKLDKEVAPGINNPFGKYALRLGESVYLLHGSNKRFGIGMRSSAGCIRLYDNDIKWLFDHVPLGTPVRIINQTVKMSYERPGVKLMEIHQPLTEHHGEIRQVQVTSAINAFIADTPWQQLALHFDKPKGLVISL